MIFIFSFHLAGRYAVISGSGNLHVRSVRSDDGVTKFACMTINVLSGERKKSDGVFLSVKGKSQI